MAIFKCKMCGGTIEFTEGASVGVCDSCGTRQSLPRLNDEHRAKNLDIADRLRRSYRFDEAADLYKEILREDDSDPEIYWLLLLCNYGVEYVEDPVTYQRVPTIHRASKTAITGDPYYSLALEHADSGQRRLYEQDARAIDTIIYKTLAISNSEEPYDVFICYKRLDENGKRTPDSVVAEEIYNDLTRDQIRVFFAEVTLNDKLGTEYEPYIYAALNSAKVMIVLGTRPDYFTAPWVKNEWKRFLKLCRENDGKKELISACRSISDLPEELRRLQAVDMGDIAFKVDIVRNTKKFIAAASPAVAAPAVAVAAPKLDNMVRRVYNEIRMGEFGEAKEVLNEVLNRDPDNAQALLAQIMIKGRIRDKSEIPALGKDLMSNDSFKLAFDKAQGPFKEELKELVKASDLERARKIAIDAENREDVKEITNLYDSAIRILDGIGNYRNANEYKEKLVEKKHRQLYEKADELYMQANRHMDSDSAPEWFKTSAEVFGLLAQENYSDASTRYDGALKMAEACENDSLYRRADALSRKRDIASQTSAAELFTNLGYWRDSNDRAARCRVAIESIRQEIQHNIEINKCEEQIREVSEKRMALVGEVNSASPIRAKRRKNNVMRVITFLGLLVIAVITILGVKYSKGWPNSVNTVLANFYILLILVLYFMLGITEIRRSGGSIALGIFFPPYMIFFVIKGFFKLFVPLKARERSIIRRVDDAKQEIEMCDVKLKELQARHAKLTGAK